MIANAVHFVFVLALLTGVPALSMVPARRPEIREAPRRALYLSAAVSQWLLALSGVAVVLVTLGSFRAIGFRVSGLVPFVRWTLLLTLVASVILLISLLLEQRGWWPAESELAPLGWPVTASDKARALRVP